MRPRSRTSWVISCWRSAAYTGSSAHDGATSAYVGFDLCLCCSTPEYVDCQGGAAVECGHDPLQGTPVVPGVAHAPALLVRGEVDPAAIERFGDGGFADADAALAAYDVAAEAVATASPRRRPRRRGAAAEVLTASAGLARDKGLRGAVKKSLTAGAPLVAAVHAAVEQFVAVFTSMGGLMAERATDLRDIERRVVAHLVGEPEPGVSLPATPVRARRRGPRARRHRRPGPRRSCMALVTEKGGPTSHTAIIARQLGIPCVVGTAGALELANGTRLLVDGTAGTIETEPDAEEADRRVAAAREQRAALAAWAGPGRTKDGAPVKLLANVADGASARKAVEQPVEGVGLFRTELCFLDRQEEPTVAEQADIYAEVLEPFGEGAVRRRAHPRRGLRQARRLRDPRGRGEPRPRRARPAPLVGQPGPAGPPARRHRRGAPSAPAPRRG